MVVVGLYVCGGALLLVEIGITFLTLAVKNVILKNVKILRNDPETNTSFLYHHLFHSNATKT